MQRPLALALLCLWCHGTGVAREEIGSSLTARVLAALQPARLTRGRLAAFAYAPVGTATSLWPLDRAIKREIERADTPAALAAAAWIKLAGHQPLNGAIAALLQARAQSPDDGAIANDLAALYLERGLRGEDPESLFSALFSAQAACRLRPRLAAARFNLGLALEALSMPDAASAAFRGDLALDPDSGWAAEAHDHLGRLARPGRAAIWRERQEAVDSLARQHRVAPLRQMLSGFAQNARFHAEQELLPRWAAAASRRAEAEAASTLSTARELGRALEEMTGDAMPSQAVAAIDRTDAAGPARAALAEGHRLFQEGTRLYADYRIDEAAAAFDGAALALGRGGTAYRLWAEVLAAACDYQRSDYGAAARRLDRVESDPDIARYPALAGNAEWLRGLGHFIGGRLMAARASYGSALADFQRAGEAGNAAAIESLLFDIDYVLGDDRQAAGHLYRALAGADDLAEPRRRQVIARAGVAAAEGSPEPAAAIYFEDDAVRWARATGNPVPLAVALRDRAKLLQRIGAHDAALTEIAAALRLAERQKDEALTADILVAEAGILGPGQSGRALADLAAALPILERTHYEESLAALYLHRGKIQLQAGHGDLAAADFRTGIAHLERTAKALDDGSLIRYLDRSSELFDEMESLAADAEGGPRASAFGYAERSRARALAQLMSGPRQADLPAVDLGTVARRLPSGVTLVEYAVLRDRLVAWVVSDGVARALVLPVGAAELKRLIARLRSAIATDQGFAEPAAALYRFLVLPLGLPPAGPIVIVPDKYLHLLPFSALRDPTSGRYLVEDHPIALSPSAGLYLDCAARSHARGARAGSILIVADPAFDRSLAPALERLPFAAADAAAIARTYGGADLLTGSQATPARFLSAIGSHAIVHYGGHAQLDPRSPYLSRLLMAPDGASPGVLFARDLYGRRFPETELVVLAACATAGDQVADSEGVSSLARPFLAAGVPAVIGTLWRVDDAAAAALSVELHRELAGGAEAAAALRGAMLHLLRSPSSAWNTPRSWAAFELFGAATAPRKGDSNGSRSDHVADFRDGTGDVGVEP